MRRSSTGEPAPGTAFAGYLIERALGSGGMGTVYVAQHPRLPRRDALKVLSAEHSASDEFRARFIREAELAARLDHPNIVTVHDRGLEQDRLWIAMQFVDGTDAAELIRCAPGRLAAQRILHIVRQAANGLDAAHRVGVLHRDVKPANILIDSHPGRPDRVLVSDFGIAKTLGGATQLTEVGSVLATLAYAAPEQLTVSNIDHRVDVYALGCTLYELLTGSKPFPRPSAGAVMAAHLNDPPPRPSAMTPHLPPAIDDVVARAMAKDPSHRYPSCGALAEAAEAAWGAAIATESVAAVRERPWRDKPATILVLLVAVAVLLTVGVVVWTVRSGNSPGTVASSSETPVPTTATKTWGDFAYLVQAFPDLLPADPDAAGYQGIRCIAVDDSRRPIDVNAVITGLHILSCNGNKNPIVVLLLKCNADRSAMTAGPMPADTTITGDESWERPSGAGRVAWGDVAEGRGPPGGSLHITFADTARKACWLTVFGHTTGQELYDNWWPSAPL
ncbi:serine/threonine-protein kinase [Nocardia otitidiscaviarum]|uniref:serine/threonine-protein kinase n=1 Tax=Nocardia otitidiscaviarum TaxID=1823 RepID=UPI00189371D3|nr:serine/threonine-protein kinase [Nocardia otitidiscaviarum]MBF6181480.1 serine/threonine protein kinase [Nocardia otitidiscaviarum]